MKTHFTLRIVIIQLIARIYHLIIYGVSLKNEYSIMSDNFNCPGYIQITDNFELKKKI